MSKKGIAHCSCELCYFLTAEVAAITTFFVTHTPKHPAAAPVLLTQCRQDREVSIDLSRHSVSRHTCLYSDHFTNIWAQIQRQTVRHLYARHVEGIYLERPSNRNRSRGATMP